MKPSEQPTQIPEKLSKGVQIAETATNKAAQVTGFVGKLGIFIIHTLWKL